MYKITWDKETGGVRLHSRIVEGTLGTSPRPVFWEELDLLKLNTLGWIYPHCEEPLLWAVNKQYFYRGELVFEAKGANIYDEAVVEFQAGKERLELEPVDVQAMLERCKEYMFLLESEAIEFINETFTQYAGARKSVKNVAANQLDYEALAARAEKKSKSKMAIIKEDCDSFDIVPLAEAEKQGRKIYHTTKIDKFIASFSGGKDSQVVLDLVTRAIPSTEFEVIYSDTGYELPPSLSLYEDVQKYYHDLYPDLKFSVARNHESVLSYWDKIGAPSDTIRWCCTIMKTAPLYRSLKKTGNKQARVLTFEGVRAEESVRRSGYERIGRGVKHDTAINARPILFWSTVEIFMYLFKYHLPINEAYRIGKARVGCIICPYSTSWDDMIINKRYPKSLEPFLSRLCEWSKGSGVKDIDEYIKERKWKFRASGNILGKQSNFTVEKHPTDFVAKLTGARLSPEVWLTAISDYVIISDDSKVKKGELRYDKSVYEFTIESGKNNVTLFTLHNAKNPELQSLLRRVLSKSTYCISCEACEVECPTGALRVLPQVSIDKSKCIHCHKCLNFHDKGCVVATSVATTVDSIMKAKTGIDRYNTFGLKEEWVDIFFSDPEEYFKDNNSGLGVKQVPAVANWLKEAEILDDKRNLTELGALLAETYRDNPDIVWEIIWINLVKNSFICKWFVSRIKPCTSYNKKSLTELFIDEFQSTYGKRTVENAIAALLATFANSPIGERFGLYVDVEKGTATRGECEDIADQTVAYSIYSYSEAHNSKTLSVSDFYRDDIQDGVKVEFAISKECLKQKLRNLNSANNRVLIAELNMGLESITLRDDLTPLSVLRLLL
jgi:phosphoadenosine phosphosulfate reductase